ncbi:MAG: hypothetical protein JXR49_23635, partial [Acidobacteria bacterium]|nr:hypothetical protein [Acidobacteriota bacterium]
MKYDPQYNDAITSMQEKHRYNTVQVQFPVDTLVHMGAGRCRELNAYLALKPQRILLVEADSLLVEDLKKRTDQHPQIQVECAAVAGNPGPVHFYRYNLPDAGSLHPASGLFQLYPGLRLVERVPMEAVGPDTLVQSLNLQDSQGNQLIVDIPGEELSVLQALQRSEKLHLFSRIRLFCGHEPLYEGGEPADRILEWLRNAGFDILNEEDHQDTDRPCWTFHRNAMQLQNREFQKRIEILQGQMEELRLDNVNLKNNIDILRTNVEMLKQERDEYARQVEDRQEQLEEAEKAGEEKTGTIVELREKVKELVGENDRRTQIVEELRANVETFKRERDEYARQVEESQDQLQEVNKAREGERKDATELRAQVGELTSERDEQSRIMGEIRIKADSFRRERDEYVRREEDRQAALEQMQKARKEDAESRAELKEQLEALARQAEDRQKELQEAAKTREEHERTIAEMQEKALKLSGERDEKTKVVSELQTKIEELKKQLEALARQAGDRQKELQEAA